MTAGVVGDRITPSFDNDPAWPERVACAAGGRTKPMLEDHIIRISGKIHLNFYKRLFSIIKEREGSLTAMEVFAVEVIHALGSPTISEFADFLGISRPGASYKVASLIQKGYVMKEA